MLEQPGKLWLYSGTTRISPSARLTVAENFMSFIASPASSIGSRMFRMSINSVVHVRSLRDLFENKPRGVFARAALPRGAEDDGQEKPGE